MASESVSIREFAKRIKVNESAIRQAIREGRMKKGFDPINKKIIISVAMKDDWVQLQKVIKQKAGVSRLKAAQKLGEPEIATNENENEEEDILANIKISKNLSVQDTIKHREVIGLEMDMMKLMQLRGILIKKEEVEKTLFAMGSELKKALLNIPSRISADIMASTSVVEIQTIITVELTDILNEFSKMQQLKLN